MVHVIIADGKADVGYQRSIGAGASFVVVSAETKEAVFHTYLPHNCPLESATFSPPDTSIEDFQKCSKSIIDYGEFKNKLELGVGGYVLIGGSLSVSFNWDKYKEKVEENYKDVY